MNNYLLLCTIETTEEQAKEVAQNDNIHVLSDMKLHDVSNMPTPYYLPEGGMMYLMIYWLFVGLNQCLHLIY